MTFRRGTDVQRHLRQAGLGATDAPVSLELKELADLGMLRRQKREGRSRPYAKVDSPLWKVVTVAIEAASKTTRLRATRRRI